MLFASSNPSAGSLRPNDATFDPVHTLELGISLPDSDDATSENSSKQGVFVTNN